METLRKKLTNDSEAILILQTCDKFNQSLTALCRARVRTRLKQCCEGKSIYTSVQSLPLPMLLKDYILFLGDSALLLPR